MPLGQNGKPVWGLIIYLLESAQFERGGPLI